jgi:transcription elongation factor Elf1
MPTDTIQKHNASSYTVAENVCSRHGHTLALFAVDKPNKKETFLCSKCGLSLDEIRKGEMD